MSTFIYDTEDAGELGAFNFTVNLEGNDYRFDFRYNKREDFWYFDMSDVVGNILRAGIKCVVNFPVIRTMSQQDRPPGEVIILDSRTFPADPQLEDLGIFSFFSYTTEDQIPS